MSPLGQQLEQNWAESYRVSDFVRASARRWKLALLTTLAGLAATFAWCWVFPDTYVSYSQLLFLPPQVSEKFVESNISLQADQRVSALTQMIGSHVTAGKIIQEFGLYPRLRRWWPVADLVPRFRTDLEIRVIDISRTEGRRGVPTVQISFRYPDALMAQRVVQRILEIIYEENQRLRSNQTFRTTDFLQRQTKEVYEQLKGAERKLEELNLADPAQRFQTTALATEKLHEIHRRLYATQLDLRRAVNELDAKRFQLQSLETRATAAGSEAIAATDASWTGHAWRIKLADARARAEETRQRYREGFPEREAAEREVLRAEAELKRVESKDRDRNESQLRQRMLDEAERLRADVDGLTRNVTSMRREESSLLDEEKAAAAHALPGQQAQFQHLAVLREHDLLKKRHEELLKKQKDSEVATEMERIGQGETIDLIEPPVLPSSAKLPVRWMKLVGGGLLGLAFGLFLPIVVLLQRPRIQSSHRLEALLGIPLLAELPMARLTAPPSLIGRHRKIRLIISTHSLLALALLIAMSGCAKDSAPDLVARGIAARQQGKSVEAGLLFRRALQMDKRYGEAYRQIAELALEQDEVATARSALIRAVELIPSEPGLRIRLAELTYRLFFGDPGRPDSLLREVEALADQLTKQWPALADGYRLAAQTLLERRRLREAITTLQAGLERLPDEPSLATQLASAFYQDGQGGQATTLLRKLMDSGSKYPPAYDLYYLQLMEAGQNEQAEGVLRAKWKSVPTVESGLQLAAHLAANGGLDGTLAQLEEVAASHASDPLAPLHIADFWINRSEPARATRWLERGKLAHPNAGPRYAGRQIELLLAANQREAARQLLADSIKTNPGDTLLEAYRVAIDLDEPGRGNESIRQSRVHLEAILSRMPNSPFVRYHLGRAYLRDGDVAKAGDQFERCVTLDPNYAMGWLALAEAHLRQGQYQRAAEEARHLEQRGATFIPLYLIEARAELGRNRPGAAERSLETLLQIAPAHSEGRLLMVQTKLALGQPAEARLRLKELLESGLDQQPDTLATAARLEASLGQPQLALDRLLRTQAQFPASDAIGAAIARLAAGVAKYDVALDQYRRLAARNPSALEYSLGVANALALLKKNAAAADQYKKVQSLSGSDPRPWLNYAVMMAESGDWDQASQGYREALQRAPRHPLALNNLADLLARRGGDLSEALNLAERAGRLLPDAPEVIDTLAHTYLRKGMTANAVASYRKLMDRLPKPERARIQARIDQIERGEAAAVLAAPGFGNAF